MVVAAGPRVAGAGATETDRSKDHSGEVSFDFRQLLVLSASRETTVNKHVLIIGGGIAGFAAGCYARINGFQATLVEQVVGRPIPGRKGLPRRFRAKCGESSHWGRGKPQNP